MFFKLDYPYRFIIILSLILWFVVACNIEEFHNNNIKITFYLITVCIMFGLLLGRWYGWYRISNAGMSTDTIR